MSAISQQTPESPVRLNLATLYAEHADLRLFVKPGDEVIVAGVWTKVTDLKIYRSGAKGRPPQSVIRNDWDAMAIFTRGGGIRWFGYPPRTLPRRPVTRRRPLW